jgi:acetoin utilization protein AcuB
MLIKEQMSHPVITVNPDIPIQAALDLMKREKIRRMPVVKNGKMVGIVSDHDLLHASPSQATSLSVWELNYLLSKITVEEVMTKEVISVTVDTPIEEAARCMADSKVGGLPVMEDGKLVGIITETDLFRVLLELMGAREQGVRLTAVLKDQPGELAKLVGGIAELKGNIIAVGEVPGDDKSTREVMLKIAGVKEGDIKKVAEKFGAEIKDLRTTS